MTCTPPALTPGDRRTNRIPAGRFYADGLAFGSSPRFGLTIEQFLAKLLLAFRCIAASGLLAGSPLA